MAPWKPPPELEKPVPRALVPTRFLRIATTAFSLVIGLELTVLPLWLLDHSGCLESARFPSVLGCLVDGEWIDGRALNVLVASGMALAGCLCWGGFLYRRYRRERRLFTFGSVAQANILGETISAWNDNDEPVSATIMYTFVDANGEIVSGARSGVFFHPRLKWLPPIRARMLSNPTVVYEPDDSRRSTLYPPTLLRFPDPGGRP